MKFQVLTSLALLAHQTNAHGYLSQPAANFINGIDTSFIVTISETVDPAFAGLKWDDSPEANTATFTKSFPNSRFSTLRALLDSAQSDCGHTVLSGQHVDVSAMRSMKWQNDQEGVGFVVSHRGPCEAWIDDTRVFQSDDCRHDFTGYPAEIPIDYSSCSGDCTFTFYWLALHEPNWQVYKQCAPIQNTNDPIGTTGHDQTGVEAPAPTSSSTDAPQTQSTDTIDTTTAFETADTPVVTNAPVIADASPMATAAPASSEAPTSVVTPVATATAEQSPESTSTTSCKTRRRRRLAANLRSEN